MLSTKELMTVPIRPLVDRTYLEQVLLSRFSHGEVQQWVQKYFQPYRELMSYYRCAIMEVETKFNVLNEELSLQYDRNPIETIKTRLKSPESIMEKLSRRGYPLTVESIEKNLNDIAGVRVICSHPADIYKLSEAFLRQDDITLLERKDYIANPKPNGYRSLHLIVETPIFLHDQKRLMKVEVQFRTISMDWWMIANPLYKIPCKCSSARSRWIGGPALSIRSATRKISPKWNTWSASSMSAPRSAHSSMRAWKSSRKSQHRQRRERIAPFPPEFLGCPHRGQGKES